ncbi:hypothetical protein GCM10022198_18190 [Klugiella xanthotipulae]|uniref:Excreted virulence factor EspC (Type VII ESX diderm) n=1 Tax=Klugiella xanthotipulae TaxID=244735 RepID=A0A543HRS5_9MICO|nr:hypothetical protein [Klugiella xanthotipulae]TQM61022.1 hypothetical protein FB466_1949 [Klugiella xanthotipulae]
MADLDFSVLLEDLTKDGNRWEQMGADLAGTYQKVLTLCALGTHVLDGVSFAQGFKGSYDQHYQEYLTFFQEGVTYLVSLKLKLDSTRAAYEASDEYQQWQAETGH